MLDNGSLSESARKMIAGVLELAPSITAFGNTNPTSYFRLVPHQEAPTNICWGDRNRSTLVRVPLGWTSSVNMSALVNPLESASSYDTKQKQTVEIRCPDGSANIYLLFASLAVAARYGFEMANALEVAEKTYVSVNIHKDENKATLDALRALPDSCAKSAECLQEQRAVYEKFNIFTPAMIDGIKKGLEAYNDASLRADIGNNEQAILDLVETYFHCG
jgi:glutamine synthetase